MNGQYQPTLSSSSLQVNRPVIFRIIYAGVGVPLPITLVAVSDDTMAATREDIDPNSSSSTTTAIRSDSNENNDSEEKGSTIKSLMNWNSLLDDPHSDSNEKNTDNSEESIDTDSSEASIDTDNSEASIDTDNSEGSIDTDSIEAISSNSVRLHTTTSIAATTSITNDVRYHHNTSKNTEETNVDVVNKQQQKQQQQQSPPPQCTMTVIAWDGVYLRKRLLQRTINMVTASRVEIEVMCNHPGNTKCHHIYYNSSNLFSSY